MTPASVPRQLRPDDASTLTGRPAVTPGGPQGQGSSEIPSLPATVLPRARLWRRLDEATRHAVTITVAPAGAGKTTGVAGWLRQSRPDVHATWFHASRETQVHNLARVLAETGPAVEGPALAVVDDAHLLPAACVRYLEERLGRDPHSFRLLLLTRRDLALGRLLPELLGDLTLVRGDSLRLDPHESRQLVEAHERSGSPHVREAIVDACDGWCAPLVLAARASPSRPPTPAGVTSGGAVVGHSAAEQVAGEVFTTLSSPARHLLLCTAEEPVLDSDTARHVTADPRAGEVLATLESTGLLVRRLEAGPGSEGARQRTRYRVHPLLLTVVRQRSAAGGVDVQHARATMLRAARLDLARGLVASGLRRLLQLGEHDAAAAVLAEHGPRLVSTTHGDCADLYLRHAELSVVQHPATWGTLAFSRWIAGDADGARHWGDRVLRHARRHPGVIPELHVACIRLHAARRGAEPVDDAVDAAVPFVDGSRSRSAQDPFLAWLLVELGVACNWLGDLARAEAHLNEAILISRSDDMLGLTAEAMSHLALTQFMKGREHACAALAGEAIALGEESATPWGVRVRSELAQTLVSQRWSLWSTVAPTRGEPAAPVPPDDLTGRFWARLLTSRLALFDGSLARAQLRLELPLEGPPLRPHLRIVELHERALHASISRDAPELRGIVAEFEAVGARGELLWARGVLADVNGDLRGAAALYRAAAAAPCQSQPPTASLALVAAAQMFDAIGHVTTATELTTAAVRATQSRRTPLPFLGWSSRGTQVALLLERVPAADASPWSAELLDTCTRSAGLAETFSPRLATRPELATVSAPRLAQALSPRERDVLNELARGSTYADIAANLYVSENTVKTHISGLYVKLCAGSRSEALAVARKMHLL